MHDKINLVYFGLSNHKQIEHENRDSNRPEFRNYNFHFNSKEMKNNTPYKFTMGNKNETKHTSGPWRTHEMSSDHWCVIVDRNGKGPIAKLLAGDSISKQDSENDNLKALNAELLDALEKLLMAAEYSRYVQKSATLEPSMITAKVLINKAKAQ